MNDGATQAVEKAVAARLGRLREVEVDVSGLGYPVVETTHLWLRSTTAVLAMAAAFSGVALVIGVLIAVHGQPHALGVADLAQMHAEAVEPPAHVTPVASLEEASRTIHASWSTSPSVAHVGRPVRACCLHEVCGRKLACLILEQEDGSMTLAVCKASEIGSPSWPTTVHRGMTCRCYKASPDGDSINAVTTERNGVLIVAVGRQPLEALLDAVTDVRL